MRKGTADIIIGTHRLLQDDIVFKNLGLIIIDEEHRYGVRQKEKFKSLRAEIDVLTLTATPIPRTLNMALSDIRELSIIATPPLRRLAVKTFVSEKNDYLLKEAILREIKRGGQVFYLHNNVKTLLASPAMKIDESPHFMVKGSKIGTPVESNSRVVFPTPKSLTLGLRPVAANT